jgi:hypothetical protein
VPWSNLPFKQSPKKTNFWLIRLTDKHSAVQVPVEMLAGSFGDKRAAMASGRTGALGKGENTTTAERIRRTPFEVSQCGKEYGS